ncbi:RDD family protein [Microcoleus sp. FACHB-1515]|uniref:RDD family protein n=1 Tax=Cyanophyceae TaxID=3028117 RepID=UPI001689ADE3|nr:RDD family protein [Microcoleus sp. FACHB-1515]MBD2088972.1 RDD family protein [Microcoleus sp. FACHB-1515]
MRFFNQIRLQTPESVELELTLAGIGNRAQALFIDYLIWGASLLVVLLAWGIVSTGLLYSLPNDNAAQLWLGAIALLLAFVVYVGYFVFFETLWHGQTPGKRYAKIRVVREDGKPAGLSQATMRSLLRPVDDLLFIGALLIVFTNREKRLGDWAAGTIVVQEERPVAAANFRISESARMLADRLLLEADINQLQPDDFAVIRNYLQQRSQMNVQAQTELCSRLAQQLQDIIHFDKVTDPELFLEAVYLAYQQQS